MRELVTILCEVVREFSSKDIFELIPEVNEYVTHKFW